MADADAQRISPRGRDDSSFLGGGAHLRPSRPRTGPPKRRHPRAAVESVRPDAGGPADGLGRTAQLPVTTRRDGRTEMACLPEAMSRQGFRPRSQAGQIVYAEKLGLAPVEERPGGLRYRCGNGEFALFESAGAADGDHTQMAWEVDDLEETIAQLRERGVILEEYDVPGFETVNGIAEVEGNYPSKGGVGEKAAWFKDSEGNLLAIGQAVT